MWSPRYAAFVKAMNEPAPRCVVLRWRHVRAVGEYRVGAGRKCLGHEAEFHERPHADRQQEVENRVGVKERIDEPIAVRDQHADVGQESVKTDVLKAQFIVAAAEMGTPVGSKSEGRVATADRMLPDVTERRRGVP